MTETESELRLLKEEQAALSMKISELEAQQEREKNPQVLDVFSYKNDKIGATCFYTILNAGYMSLMDKPGDKAKIMGQWPCAGPGSVFSRDHYKYEGHFSDVFIPKARLQQFVEDIRALKDKYNDTLQKSAGEKECWYLDPKGTEELWELVEGLSEQVSQVKNETYNMVVGSLPHPV